MKPTKPVRNFSVMLLAVLILSSFGIWCSAAVGQGPQRQNAGRPAAAAAVGLRAETGIALAAENYETGFQRKFFWFYGQLDKYQKAVYNKLYYDFKPGTDKIEVQMPDRRITGDQDEVEYEVIRIVQGALDALLKDCPEFFWVDISGTSVGYEYTPLPQNRMRLEEIIINTATLPDYSQSDIDMLIEEVNNFPVEGETVYEQLLSIHDGLARRISYDYSPPPLPASSYDAYGALIEGLAVCEGYSEAFKLICDRLNIPCILVVGYVATSGEPGPHMWNAVEIGGAWYLVDVTWDDHTDSFPRVVFNDCFLVGTNTELKRFGGYTFGESHQPSGYFTRARHSTEFKYPEFALERYIPGSGPITEPSTIPDVTVLPPTPLPPTTAQTLATTKPVIAATTTTTTTKKTAAQTTRKTGTVAATTKPATTTAVTNTTAPQSVFVAVTGTEGSSKTESINAGGGIPVEKAVIFVIAGSAVLAAGMIGGSIILSLRKRNTGE